MWRKRREGRTERGYVESCGRTEDRVHLCDSSRLQYIYFLPRVCVNESLGIRAAMFSCCRQALAAAWTEFKSTCRAVNIARGYEV